MAETPLKEVSVIKPDSDILKTKAHEVKKKKRHRSEGDPRMKLNIPQKAPESPGIRSSGYEETLSRWIRNGKKDAYVYEFVLDKYKTALSRCNIATLVLTSIVTFVSIGDLSSNSDTNPTISYILKVANVICGLSAAIVVGVPQIAGWSSLIDNCQKYFDTIEAFLAPIYSEKTLPAKYRVDPEQFILEKKMEYQSLLSSAPTIPRDDYIKALEFYDRSKSTLRYDLRKDE